MSKNSEIAYHGGEYTRLGDYHKNLDPNLSYTPTYLQKMAFVEQFIQSQPRTARFKWLHDALEPLARAFPSLAMLTIFVCQKGGEPRYGAKVSALKRRQV